MPWTFANSLFFVRMCVKMVNSHQKFFENKKPFNCFIEDSNHHPPNRRKHFWLTDRQNKDLPGRLPTNRFHESRCRPFYSGFVWTFSLLSPSLLWVKKAILVTLLWGCSFINTRMIVIKKINYGILMMLISPRKMLLGITGWFKLNKIELAIQSKLCCVFIRV